MKLKSFLAGLVLCLVSVLLISAETASAKTSKKIVLTPETTMETHKSLFIDVEISLKDVATLECVNKKVTKTADSLWKDSEAMTSFWYDEDSGKTKTTLYVEENGTYSVRAITKNGKKYVNFIKVKNLAPVDEDVKLEGMIRKISKPDKKGNYTITVDFYEQISLEPSAFKGKKVGDTLSVGGRMVTIMSMHKMDKDYNVIDMKQFDESTEMIVVRPKKATDFWNVELNEWVLDAPENADFGFIKSYSGDEYLAYSDYDYWEAEGYYCDMSDLAIKGAKFKVNGKTTVRLAYSFGDDAPKYISGTKYLAIKQGKETVEGVNVYDGVSVYIYRKYNKKTGKFTNVVSEIKEIYMP